MSSPTEELRASTRSAVGDVGCGDDAPTDVSEEAENEGGDHGIHTTRWAFLSPYLTEWLCLSSPSHSEVHGREDLCFDSFTVYLPGRCETPADDEAKLTLTRHATELVACMLHVDPTPWWLLREAEHHWYRLFYPAEYDRATLVPKMEFTAGGLYGMHSSERLEDVERLRVLLCGTGEQPPDQEEYHAYKAAKSELRMNHDPELKLRDYHVPIGLVLSPSEPVGPDELFRYVETVVSIAQDLQEKRKQVTSGDAWPFVLEAIHLTMYEMYLDVILDELRKLGTCGIRVNITVRPLPRAFRDMLCTTQGSHVCAALATNPGRVDQDEENTVAHTLQLPVPTPCGDLWSAIAFAPRVAELTASMQHDADPLLRRSEAQWLSYALRYGRLKSLTLQHFDLMSDDMAAFREIAESSDPTRLLASSSATASTPGPQLVRLKPDAIVDLADGFVKSLKNLTGHTDWCFPVVSIDSDADRIRIVVPGYGICSTLMVNVESLELTTQHERKQTLHSLDVTSLDRHQAGAASCIVELYGRSLRHLRWVGSDNTNNHDQDASFDGYLAAILSFCPHLESLELGEKRLHSLQSLVRRYESQDVCLRTLTLANVPVPPCELAALFRHLADPLNRLARTLQWLTFYSSDNEGSMPFRSFDEEVIDAALAMLRSNRTLYHIEFALSDELWDAHHARFEAEEGVRVKTKRLPLRKKLAFLSVVQNATLRPRRAVNGLDSAFVTRILTYFTHSVVRRVIIQRGFQGT